MHEPQVHVCAHAESGGQSRRRRAVQLDAGDEVVTTTYTATGQVASSTKTGTGTHSSVYDDLGRVTSDSDPDRGTTSYGYDPAGNITSTSDARGITINSAYDLLGRHLQDVDAANPSVVLASWTYANTAGTYPLLAGTTRRDADARTWTTSYSYDNRYRVASTTTTFSPAYTNPNLSGPWTVTKAYNGLDAVTSVTEPLPATVAGGPKGSETIQTSYDNSGRPAATQVVNVANPLVTSNYDALGRTTTLTGSGLGGGLASQLNRTYTYHPQTGRLVGLQATIGNPAAPSVVAQNLTYTYDTPGNVVATGDVLRWEKECYRYDAANHLIGAYTTTNNWCVDDSTNSGIPGTGNPGTGTDTYDLAWTIAPHTAITSQLNSAGTVTGYTYNGNQPTAVGATTYTNNQIGARTTATTSGATTTYTWDTTARLATVKLATDTNPTRYSYLADGTRIAKVFPAGWTIISLDGIEIAANNTTTTLAQGTRYYTHTGRTIALRQNDGTIHWLLGDRQGSATASIQRGTTTVNTYRYRPYGNQRGTGSTLPTERDFLGQTYDDTSKLHYLNNRYLDNTTGLFISVDPMVSKTGDPYLYAAGNPTTLSDPTGLDPACSPSAPAGACGAEHADQGKQFGKAVMGRTLQAGEPSLRDQESMVTQTMGLSFPDFDGSWTEWYQMINVFYWVHRLVQAHISGTSGGRVMTEYTGCGGRIDLCANGLAGMEVAELKLLGVGGTDGARNSAQRQLQNARDFYGGGTLLSSMGDPWPMMGSLPVGPMVVSWENQNLGLYTYEISGGLPTLPAWRDFKATSDLREAEVRLREPATTPTNWGPIGAIATVIGIGIATGAGAAACAGTGGTLCPVGA